MHVKPATVVAWVASGERVNDYRESGVPGRQPLLAGLLHASSEGIVLCRLAGATIVEMSDACLALTGYAREELVGRSATELGFVPVEVHERLVAGTGEVGWRHGGTAGLPTKTGAVRSVELSADVIRDETDAYMLVVLRDVSERERAEEAVRESERRYRRRIDSVADHAVIMLDPAGLVTGWSPGAERIQGYRAEQIVGRDFSVFYAPERIAAGDPGRDLAAARAEGRHREEGARVRMDGSRFWADVTITAVPHQGGRLGFAEVTREIRERRATEAAPQAGEPRGLLLAENSRDVIRLYDVDETIRYASPSCLTVLGFAPEELIGRHAGEFRHPDDAAGGNPGSPALATRSADDAVSYRSRLKDGSFAWLESSVVALHDDAGQLVGYQEAARDVTARKDLEAALVAAEERYRDLFENATTGITQVTMDGHPVAVNSAWASLLGYESPSQYRAEVLTADDLYVDPADRAALMSALHERGSVSDFEVRLRRRDGDTAWVALGVRMLNDGEGKPVGLRASGVDIAARRRVEEEALRAKEQAERANEAKSDFLSRMSHELRTPLHAILGFGELLGHEEMPVGQRGHVNQINRGASHLLELIDEILDLAAIERSEVRLSREPIEVGKVIAEVLELVAPLAAARSLRVSVSPAATFASYVKADRQRLKQVLLNLLSNAVKYNRDGGSIRVACTGQGADRVLIEVADTGLGIAAHDLGRVFEPFDRLGKETSGVEGTGLGLALTKRLVLAMGGEIGADSEVGAGTRFWVELAVDAAPRAKLPPEAPELNPGSTRLCGPARTVLYIEDNPSNIKLVEAILTMRPEVTLLVAAQGSLGLELVREHQPSLVLLDLNLPDMPGAEVLRRIRGEPRTSEIPVVMLSADANPGMMRRLRRAGADDYLTKPFGIERFLSLVDGNATVHPADPEPTAEPDANETPAVLSAETVRALHELAGSPRVAGHAVTGLIGSFLADAPRGVAAIHAAVGGGDLVEVAHLAHGLAGASGSVGAGELATRCQDLEAAAKQHASDAVDTIARGLDQSLADARIALTVEFELPTIASQAR